mmetsp:Transcript_3549/g.7112  ORF Transcript_3549/g.7112 Transcript_3549/m.7112 type:complete len:214 (-) Transcript_3549:264-905(-)
MQLTALRKLGTLMPRSGVLPRALLHLSGPNSRLAGVGASTRTRPAPSSLAVAAIQHSERKGTSLAVHNMLRPIMAATIQQLPAMDRPLRLIPLGLRRHMATPAINERGKEVMTDDAVKAKKDEMRKQSLVFKVSKESPKNDLTRRDIIDLFTFTRSYGGGEDEQKAATRFKKRLYRAVMKRKIDPDVSCDDWLLYHEILKTEFDADTLGRGGG